MTDLENLLDSTDTVIVVRDGSYHSLIFPYDETTLFTLLNSVKIETTYSGSTIESVSKLEIKIAKSSEYKKLIEKAKLAQVNANEQS